MVYAIFAMTLYLLPPRSADGVVPAHAGTTWMGVARFRGNG
jgi:hypothetical protein